MCVSVLKEVQLCYKKKEYATTQINHKMAPAPQYNIRDVKGIQHTVSLRDFWKFILVHHVLVPSFSTYESWSNILYNVRISCLYKFSGFLFD